jgi:hypothetical protein
MALGGLRAGVRTPDPELQIPGDCKVRRVSRRRHISGMIPFRATQRVRAPELHARSSVGPVNAAEVAVMDAEMVAYWSRLVDYHERQAEMWLSFAEQRRSTLSYCRAVSTILRKSWPAFKNEQFERSMESRVEQCRRMAADHRWMACHYRASLDTPWPTVARLGRVVLAARG